MSKVQICNMALGFLGEASISAMEENSPQGVACRAYFAPALRDLLREHTWNFAQSRVRLALMETPEEWQQEYALCYAYPQQSVLLQYILTPQGDKSQRFTIADVNGRKAILTNIPAAVAVITRYVEDTTLFDGKFTLALARNLQRLLVTALLKNGNQNMVMAAEQLYQQALAAAQLADAREGRPFQDAVDFWDERNEGWIRSAVDGFY